MSKVKILLVGSVGENFQVLQKKLKTLNSSKAGPFDVCFCVGSTKVPAVTTSLPLPVYLQEYSSEDDSFAPKNSKSIISLGNNLWHLANTENTNTSSIPIFEIPIPNQEHPLMVASCSRHIRTAQEISSAQQCDLLLSPDWPQGMEDVLQVETEPLSFDVAQVALNYRPRYHVSPSSQYYHTSPPYDIPNSSHVGRFLALGPVIKEKPSKTTKFIHAIGLVPIKANPPPTTAASTLPCPFLSPIGSLNAKPGFRLSDSSTGYSRFNNNKRSRNGNGDGNNNEVSLEPPDDPSVNTLFLYGLHNDVTGELQSTQSSKVLLAFGKYDVTKVRHPNSRTSTYCFLEFPDQAKALKCLLDCQGLITIDNVDLTLKWATQNSNKRQRQHHEPKQHYVTQSEAPDSTTLYFHPPRVENNNSNFDEMDESFGAKLCAYIQSTLEEALNEGNDEQDRVTAETEPALKVEVRIKEHYGFLEFASHAAATMALAAVTNSTDGGLIVEETSNNKKPPSNLCSTTLRWAKGTKGAQKQSNGRDQVLEALGLQRQHFPKDSRTDCWFCLASPTCETHLIIGVYDNWYATMPKGPLHDGHVLLVPVTHTNQGAWTLQPKEWTGLVEKLQAHAIETYDMDLLVFERAMETKGGYHSHVQCVPIPKDCTANLRQTMLAHAKACGFDLRVIESDLGISSMVSSDDSYFYAEILTQSHRHRFLYKHTDESSSRVIPLQFAREVMASVLKNPKLAHWKSCVVDKEQETELASQLRTSFAPMLS
jgi:hypothetical protein